MISISASANLLVHLIVAWLIFGVLWWMLGRTGLGEPFGKVSRVALAVLAAVVTAGALMLGMVPGQPIFRP